MDPLLFSNQRTPPAAGTPGRNGQNFEDEAAGVDEAGSR
jgi:hypothetical protein